MSDIPVAPPSASPGVLGRVVKGTAALGLVAAINMVGQFAIVPIALAFWGAAQYGEWVALTALITSLTLADLGVQTHVVNLMCAHHARGDIDAVMHDMHSAVRVQMPLALGLLAAGSLAVLVFPVASWFRFETVSSASVTLALIFLAAEVLLWVPMGVVAGTHRATGRLARAAVMQSVQRLGQFVFPVGLIALGMSFPVVAFARLAVALASFAWIIVDLRHLYPWFRLWPLEGKWRHGTRMLGPGALFLLASLSDYVALQGTIMVLQSTLGGAEVALFATQRTIINMGRMVSTQLTLAAWPELTVLDAKGDGAGLARAHRSLAKVNGWLVGALLIGFLPLAQTVYDVWTLGKLSIDGWTLGLLMAQTILWGFWRSGTTILQSTNRQGRLVPILLVNAAVGIGIAIALVPTLGIRGAALAGLLGDLAIAMWVVPFATTRAIGDTLGGYLREIVPVVVLALALPALLAGLLWWALPWPLARELVVPPAFGLVSLAVFWRLLEPDERAATSRVAAAVLTRLRLARRPPAARPNEP